MRLYYAHAICIYGTAVEAKEVDALGRCFPSCVIVNTGLLQAGADKNGDKMQYFFHLIDDCDVLVFSRLLDKVTAGVGLEANHAIDKRIPVYELANERLTRVVRPMSFLSKEETLNQYDAWWRGQANAKPISVLKWHKRV